MEEYGLNISSLFLDLTLCSFSVVSESCKIFPAYVMMACKGAVSYAFTFLASTLYGGGRLALLPGRLNPTFHKTLGYQFCGSRAVVDGAVLR